VNEWVWSIGGMILTGENWITGRKTCPSATPSTKYTTWTDPVSNPGLRVEVTPNHVRTWRRFFHFYRGFSTLTEVFLLWLRFFLHWLRFFPFLFLSCKANARVKTRKDGARPALLHISCYLRCSLLFALFYVLFGCKCVLPPGDNPIAINKCIISYKMVQTGKPTWELTSSEICCSEYSVRNNPEECSTQRPRGGSLIPLMVDLRTRLTF
jgi:hypothetical protein